MKTKLYVLTGFLGSGKTTVLLKLLEMLSDKKIGVIQNEFGKLGIDGIILRNDNIEMVEITKGSIFCTCRKLDFVQALADMSSHEFDYLFVEGSGISDPSNVTEILEAARVVSGKEYDFAGLICMVDALNLEDQLAEEDLETAFRQLKHCHLAVVTKTDLTSEEETQKVEEMIRQINPICPIVKSVMGEMDYSWMEEDLMKYQWAENEDSTDSPDMKPKTLFMNFEGEMEKAKLMAFFEKVAPELYRSKGFFHFKEEGWQQVDLVGKQVDFKPCSEKEKSQLVFISKNGTKIIRTLFAAWEEVMGTKMDLKN